MPLEIEALELVADEKERLRLKIAWLRLRYELDDASPEEVIALSAEVESFKRTCKALRGEWGLA